MTKFAIISTSALALIAALPSAEAQAGWAPHGAHSLNHASAGEPTVHEVHYVRRHHRHAYRYRAARGAYAYSYQRFPYGSYGRGRPAVSVGFGNTPSDTTWW